MMKLIDLYYKAPLFLRYPVFLTTGALQARKRYGKLFHQTLNDLLENMELTRDQIDVMQNELLKRLLLHSYENVPYYHKVFDQSGFHPGKYKDTRDLKKIPYLTKSLIKENYDDLLSITMDKRLISRHQTGGTTGKPLQFILPNELKGPFDYATLYRFYSWAGIHFGDSRVSIAGRLTTKKPPYAMINKAENQLYVCAHHLEGKNLPAIVESMHKYHPVFVQGHPSAITIIAQYMTQCGDELSVKAVFTTSENLYPDQRVLIEKAFKCKVWDTYGMGEMVAMASECKEHKGYHFAPEYGYTEVISFDQYQDFGELISTSLKNYSMPFIRYKTGDLGNIDKYSCPCGSHFPMIKQISGRIDDILEFENGKIILPLVIRTQMKTIGVDNFQIVRQMDRSCFVNIFDIDEKYKKKVGNNVKVLLDNLLGESQRYIINFDKERVLSKSGKTQMIIDNTRKKDVEHDTII